MKWSLQGRKSNHTNWNIVTSTYLDERSSYFVPYEEGYLCFKLTGTKIVKNPNSVNKVCFKKMSTNLPSLSWPDRGNVHFTPICFPCSTCSRGLELPVLGWHPFCPIF